MSDQVPPPLRDDSGKKKMPEKQSGPSDGVLMGLGLNLTGTVLLFVALGWWLDSRYGWTPWGMVGLGGLGLALGLYQLVRETNR